MAKKKVLCSLCDASYESKFCFSLHQRLHNKKPETSIRFQCPLCKKGFVKFIRYKWHVLYHGYTSSVKSPALPMNKDSGKLEVVSFLHSAC